MVSTCGSVLKTEPDEMLKGQMVGYETVVGREHVLVRAMEK